MKINNSVIEKMLAHRSIRSFTDVKIDIEMLEQLVLCGQSAASSSFIQAYSIVRVTNKNYREQIAEAAGDQQYVKDAPEFLIFCADLKRVELACENQGFGKLDGYTEHFIAATVDVALVAQNFLLAAESLGLGGVYIGGIRNDPQLISELLNLPEQVYPVFGMCLGWPDSNPDIKPRFPVASALHTNRYDISKVEDDIDAYDQMMQMYYQARSDNKRSSDWSAQTAKAVQLKQRAHMLPFLNQRGFLKK